MQRCWNTQQRHSLQTAVLGARKIVGTWSWHVDIFCQDTPIRWLVREGCIVDTCTCARVYMSYNYIVDLVVTIQSCCSVFVCNVRGICMFNCDTTLCKRQAFVGRIMLVTYVAHVCDCNCKKCTASTKQCACFTSAWNSYARFCRIEDTVHLNLVLTPWRKFCQRKL